VLQHGHPIRHRHTDAVATLAAIAAIAAFNSSLHPPHLTFTGQHLRAAQMLLLLLLAKEEEALVLVALLTFKLVGKI
jgi:hypothetical protein